MKGITGILVKVSLLLLAAVITTASHFVWVWIGAHQPGLVPVVYIFSWLILASGAYFILRQYSLYSYKKYQKLTNTALFLVCTNWGIYFAFPSLYSPYNWAWSFTNEVNGSLMLRLLSCLFIIAGLSGLAISGLELGIIRTIGHAPRKLMIHGIYRFTRNPQIVSAVIAVLGYTILRPSWYALGWMILLTLLSHLMILSEEKHLQNIFGVEYKNYCSEVPRYLLK